MNGVRRFLVGGGTPTTPTGQQSPVSPSTPPPAAALQSPFQSRAPLAVPAKASWPPLDSPPQSPTESSPPNPMDSPKTTTAALFFRKDRQRPLPTASTTDEGVVGNGSFHSPQSSRGSNGISPAHSNGSFGLLSSPGAGPSSPRLLPSRVSELTRKPVAMEARPTLVVYNAKDDLLISLLASEAIVDSRGCEILSAEEVDELKKEHQVLSSRLAALTKKLALENKIRDAAVSLSRANASYKNVSKQTSEQLDTANRKVEQAQKDLWQVSERANEIQRKLLEHRAGVLSYSVRSLEKKAAPPDGDSNTSGYSSPSRSAQMSPTLSSATSMTTVSSGRFEHFFAGHSDAVTPTTPRLPPTMAEVAALEAKLKAATAALEAASAKQGEMTRELSLLRLEKEQIETTLGMDLQAAEETIATLEQSAGRAEDVDVRLQELEEEREAWRQDRVELEERRREVDTLERRLEVLEEQSGEVVEMQSAFAREREELRGMLAARERKLEETQRQLADMKMQWDADRSTWEAEKAALQDGAQSKVELAECTDALRDLMHTHGILLASRDPSLIGLVQSVALHVEDMHAKAEAHERAEDEWAALRTKLEMDVRAGLDKREALFAEVEEARRTRDEARTQVRDLEAQLREQATAQVALANLQAPQGPVDFATDAASIIALLQPLWVVLPSPEARASKLNTRNMRPGSGSSSPVLAGRNNASISDMDVRSLKTLYDPRGTAAQPSAAFTVEGFVARVQALATDDRALIERLIRFAQAHDLLKKNAERAQKLAQESSNALETYQKQVNMLEERNLTMIARQQALDEEVQQLQEIIEQITAEKVEIENQAAEQAETCRQLTDANNTLSARMLALAEDAASAGGSAKQQLEAQLAECNAALARAKDEIESIRGSQQMQQMALLEELNSVQTENANLREQLRKR